jgi:hypothetical protein
VRVSLGTIVVSDDCRRAINYYYGRPGLATRDDVRNFYLGHADSDLNAVVDEWRCATDANLNALQRCAIAEKDE